MKDYKHEADDMWEALGFENEEHFEKAGDGIINKISDERRANGGLSMSQGTQMLECFLRNESTARLLCFFAERFVLAEIAMNDGTKMETK